MLISYLDRDRNRERQKNRKGTRINLKSLETRHIGVIGQRTVAKPRFSAFRDDPSGVTMTTTLGKRNALRTMYS